jgi:hypothetical protein
MLLCVAGEGLPTRALPCAEVEDYEAVTSSEYASLLLDLSNQAGIHVSTETLSLRSGEL